MQKMTTREAIERLCAFGEREFRHLDFRGWDLSGLDLSGLDFAGADFSQARLVGTLFDDADLTGAKFEGRISSRPA